MITLSMSAIHTYLRCPKKFQLRYIQGWEDNRPEKAALAQGTAFHAYMEQYAKKQLGVPLNEINWATPMGEVALGYIITKGFPPYADILSVDDPQFVHIVPGVRLRTTFDLVYTRGDQLIVRDYKTFDRAPSLDVDLDFQSRTYLWAARQIWPGFRTYIFEHEHVRRTQPNIIKDKSGGRWTPSECYLRSQLILSAEETEEDGRELRNVIHDILKLIETKSQMWFRVPLKGGGYDQCTSCFVKEVCKAEKQGTLNNEAAYLSLASKKDTIYDGV